MGNRGTLPMLVKESGSVQSLRSMRGSWTESDLQSFVLEHPSVLPVADIEPVFGDLIPLAGELRVPSGRLDALFVNSQGLLTVVECKLWRNEESRRAALGQILEYASDLSRWSYSDLQQAVRSARGNPEFELASLVAEHAEGFDESRFVDGVSRNLRLGRFLLLVVGDGIRERMQDLAAFLQSHAHLNFTLSMVELGLFEVPGNGLLVQPRVLLKTLEVERSVVRVEDGRVVISAPAANALSGAAGTRRQTVSLQVFLEELAGRDPIVARQLEG